MANQSDDVAAIKQLVQDWHAGWQDSDVEALLALFTDDPVLMPDGQPSVMGKDAIRSLYEAFFAVYIVKGECDLQEVEVSCDLGYFWVNYTLTATPKAGGAKIKDDSKSVFIVRRQGDDSWKIARLMDNSNREKPQ
jgi:uncharacterized protein (TIGR02246 family)